MEQMGMWGVQRKMVFMAVGAFAKVVANVLNSTSVYNADTLIHLVRSRPPGVPLITVSNHMSTLDDPVMWGFKGFPISNPTLARWVLAAEDICFKNSLLSYFFRLGKCIPITRGAGIHQEHMNEALEHLSNGEWGQWLMIEWKHLGNGVDHTGEDVPPVTFDEKFHMKLMVSFARTFEEKLELTARGLSLKRGKLYGSVLVHHYVGNFFLEITKVRKEFQLHTFPEGKVIQEDGPIRRLKWGTASLIARAPLTPIVLPIVHRGFEEVMPEKYLFGRRPPFPLCCKKIEIIVGEPIQFDIPRMKEMAISMSRNCSTPLLLGWPNMGPTGLDEAAQRFLYIHISDQIRGVMEKLRCVGNDLRKLKV